MKSIIFYAPLGRNLPSHLFGGGEAGCNRTLQILQNNGYVVKIIDKPVMGLGKLPFLKMTICAFGKYLYELLVSDAKIIYVVGFYENNLFVEKLYLQIARFFNKKTVYEARNGRLIAAYEEKGVRYKRTMKNTLKLADLIFCQGSDYLDFVTKLVNKKAIYTPNYVMEKYCLDKNMPRSTETLRLIYCGRITPSKNIHVMIDTLQRLLQIGLQAELCLIGGFENSYKSELDQSIAEQEIPPETIRFLGKQRFAVIKKEMLQAHFFVFPSAEKKEGHSNALTEAMAFGVVPVVSIAGFNASVVNKPELVCDIIAGKNFADTIQEIWFSGKWLEYSQDVFQNVRSRYTEKIVKDRIIEALGGL